MNQYFTEEEAARRYDMYRPKVHSVVLEWLNEHCGRRRYSKGIDIACGTGDSTIPLIEICDDVLGLDSSKEMLRFAAAKGLTVKQAQYEDLDEGANYDLITTCMAFHWFDAAKAIAGYKKASAVGAIWVIYSFAFAGHETSERFNAWFAGQYLKSYPSPPRNKMASVVPRDDTELELIAEGQGIIPLQFDHERLIGYLSTQTNIEAAVKSGGRYEAICKDLLSQIEDIDVSGAFKYAYSYEIHGYNGSQQDGAVDAASRRH